MRLRRIRVTLRPVLAAILAVTLPVGGSCPPRPADPPRGAPARVRRRSSICTTRYFCTTSPTINRRCTCRILERVRRRRMTFYSAAAGPSPFRPPCSPALQSYRAGQVPGLPDGSYWLEIASDQPLASVVEIYRTTGDRLAAYRGMTAPTGVSAAGPSVPVYRSVFSPFFDSGGLTLWNISAQAAQAEIDLYQSDGSLVKSLNTVIPANATYFVYGAGIQIPPGLYTAVVSSTEPLAGLLTVQTAGLPSPVFELQAPTATRASRPACRAPRSRWMKEVARARANSS